MYSLPARSMRMIVGLVLLAGTTGILSGVSPELIAPASAQSDVSKDYVMDVLNEMSKRTGLTLLCDTATSRERVVWPGDKEPMTATNVEKYLERLVNSMPTGSLYGKLYLPPPPKDSKWRGDDVLAFATAQAKLFGRAGAIPPPGQVEILSQRLSEEKAKPIIEAMGLKPVYLVVVGPGNYTGVWSSTFGEMRLRQVGSKVSGTYTSSDGVIEGSIRNGVFRFRWLERDTGGKGSGRFIMAEDGQSFSGNWGYDDNPDTVTSTWVGKRLSRNP